MASGGLESWLKTLALTNTRGYTHRHTHGLNSLSYNQPHGLL